MLVDFVKRVVWLDSFWLFVERLIDRDLNALVGLGSCMAGLLVGVDRVVVHAVVGVLAALRLLLPVCPLVRISFPERKIVNLKGCFVFL